MDFEIEDEIDEVFEEQDCSPRPIGVYVRRNSTGKIIEINSDLFIDDLTGWEKIDEGFGDRFAHAQNLYKVKTDSV